MTVRKRLKGESLDVFPYQPGSLSSYEEMRLRVINQRGEDNWAGIPFGIYPGNA